MQLFGDTDKISICQGKSVELDWSLVIEWSVKERSVEYLTVILREVC